jgi:hypothetical protein
VTILGRRCDRLVTVTEVALQSWKRFPARYGSRAEPIGPQHVVFGMATKRKRHYSIEIKDAKGLSVFITAADWSAEQQRAAVAQIMRLMGVSIAPARDEPEHSDDSGGDASQ